MPPLLRFLLNRLVSIPITFLIITAVLYAGVMITPAETRATLYLPKNLPGRLTEEDYQRLINQVIKRQHLDDPYPIQYFTWIGSLVQGGWGYSPTLQEEVLPALLRRTPATAELTLYSLLLFIPLGLISGALASWHYHRPTDHFFRFSAFLATSLPPFILALFLMAIFYVALNWFSPERLSLSLSFAIHEPSFHAYTGLLTIDGLLNNRLEITVDAMRHLAMPVFTLSLLHWATLGRVMRATMLDEIGKEYILAARSRGIPQRRVIWKHALRNAVAPALTSSVLSAATLVTGVFVVEIIYNFHGVSDLILRGARLVPDAPATLGFAVYSVIVVLLLMFVLDMIQALVDPRVREGMLHA